MGDAAGIASHSSLDLDSSIPISLGYPKHGFKRKFCLHRTAGLQKSCTGPRFNQITNIIMFASACAVIRCFRS